MFNLTLTKSLQQRKTARHYRTPMKGSILILILRSKQYSGVVYVVIVWSLDETLAFSLVSK